MPEATGLRGLRNKWSSSLLASLCSYLLTLYSTKQCVMAGCDGQAKVDVLMDWW